ncbi:MAG: 3-methyl-2-oxobutanoate dehydrogenase subunit beta, partial [Oscillospiraceae bacterium]|nr:3-methyl-2-oxobutanoate dehydrogenase subunit beta [Oscillospiraceae bacterium]
PKLEPKEWAACGHKGGRKHNIINSLFLQPDELEASVDARYEKYETIKKNIHDAEIYKCEDADLVIAAFGTTARVAKSAVNQAREKGIKAGLFRPKTLWPFPVEEINEACKNAKKVLSVEMSKGQMVDDIRLALNCRIPVEFFGRNGGNIPTPAEILDEIVKISERGL